MNITHKHAFLQFSLSLFLVTGAFAQSYVSSAHQSQITGHVGEYTAPPRGIQRLRVGVPPSKYFSRTAPAESAQPRCGRIPGFHHVPPTVAVECPLRARMGCR